MSDIQGKSLPFEQEDLNAEIAEARRAAEKTRCFDSNEPSVLPESNPIQFYFDRMNRINRIRQGLNGRSPKT